MTAVQREASSFTDQQIEFLEDFREWLHSSTALVYYLAGYAGTGKTTVAAEVARLVDGPVVYMSPTGKAAARMREAGCVGADTIDSVIYRSQYESYCTQRPPCETLCDGRCPYLRDRYIGKELNPDSILADAVVGVIDEGSMVADYVMDDVMSFGAPILIIADHGQLQPVYGTAYITGRRPDYRLETIHRQAAGSPVIKLATRAREGRGLRYGMYGDSEVTDDVPPRDYPSFDIIIAGKNATRRTINNKCRRVLGFGGEIPEPGERLVCLKNNRERNIRNGEIWHCVEAVADRHGFADMLITNEEGRRVDVVSPIAAFNCEGTGSDFSHNPFAFGYCLTCHKSQGSEWDSVLVIDESDVFGRDRSHWLYTAITRASQRVVVVVR